MTNLLLGAQYITEEDRRHLTFCGDHVTEQYIRDFSEKLAISDVCLSHIAMFPAPLVLRSSIPLAFAAMKSRDFNKRTVYGFCISVRSNYQNGGQVFLDLDGVNVLLVKACEGCRRKWEILHLSPEILAEEYVYGDVIIASVLKACNEVYSDEQTKHSEEDI